MGGRRHRGRERSVAWPLSPCVASVYSGGGGAPPPPPPPPPPPAGARRQPAKCAAYNPPIAVGDTGNVWAPECGNIAAFNGRSDPGFHAGEISRVLAWLSTLPYVQTIDAVLAANHTDAAVLHELIARPVGGIVPPRASATSPPAAPVVIAPFTTLALVAPTKYEYVAGSKFYNIPPYMDVAGALAAYDLPDLAAAAIHMGRATQLLAFSPTDSMRVPLSLAEASEMFAFAAAVAKSHGGGANVSVVTCTPASAAEVVRQLLASLLAR
jgi:hypothetical protein